MAFFHPNFFLQTPHQGDDHDGDHNHNHTHTHNHDQNHPSTSLSHQLLPPSCTPQEFHGVGSLLGKRSTIPFPTQLEEDMNKININNVRGEDELSDDDGSQVGEKKRRLNMEQVRTLEKNFELGNKLEPQRKMQLAQALGLQPRQIAIWFQNRRARWKTKKLEKDYDVLKRQFEAVKAENEALEAQNKKLHDEIQTLVKTREPTESINLNKLETEGSSSTNRSDENTSEIIKLDISTTTAAIDNNNNKCPSLSTHLLFPAASSLQLFQNNNSSHCPKMDHHQPQQNVKEENLCNMFCGVDDQTGFWPWLEHQHFN